MVDSLWRVKATGVIFTNTDLQKPKDDILQRSYNDKKEWKMA